MPTVQANGIDIYYEVQGEGEPLVLVPYLAADQACYAFQIADYAKHFTCFTVDLRGAGLCSKPEGDYTTELLADDGSPDRSPRRYPAPKWLSSRTARTPRSMRTWTGSTSGP
jgi:pimeloyl-ACP methyl ester carboxylesterase